MPKRKKKYEYKYVCTWCEVYQWRRGPNAKLCAYCCKLRLERTGERRERK